MLFRSLQSGNILQYKDGEWLTDQGKKALRPSKRCTEQIERVQKNGYEPQYAKVNFIVFWRKEEGEQEIRIVLPELHFERKAKEDGEYARDQMPGMRLS